MVSNILAKWSIADQMLVKDEALLQEIETLTQIFL